MLTIIASILGFLGALIPEIFGIIKFYFKNKNDELLLNKRIELLKAGVVEDTYLDRSENIIPDILDKDNININDIQEYKSYKLDKLNSSVRPLLAYGFFFLYLAIKCIQIYYIRLYILCVINDKMDLNKLQAILPLIWSEQDQIFLPMIISSYFGQRIMNAYMTDIKNIMKKTNY